MASTSKEDRRYECSLCLERFKDPRILACIHTFCKSCLERYLNEKFGAAIPGRIFDCPLCRAGLRLPNGGVDAIQKNFYLEEPSKSNFTACSLHPEEDLRFYCRVCDVAICRDCKVVSHDGHKIDLTKDVCNEVTQDFDESLSDAEKVINENEIRLREGIEPELYCLEEVLADAASRVGDLKYDLDHLVEVIGDFINPHLQRKRMSLLNIEKRASDKIKCLKDYKEQLLAAMRLKEKQAIMALSKELVEKMKNNGTIEEDPSMSDSDNPLDASWLDSECFCSFDKISKAIDNFRMKMDNYRTTGMPLRRSGNSDQLPGTSSQNRDGDSLTEQRRRTSDQFVDSDSQVDHGPRSNYSDRDYSMRDEDLRSNYSDRDHGSRSGYSDRDSWRDHDSRSNYSVKDRGSRIVYGYRNPWRSPGYRSDYSYNDHYRSQRTRHDFWNMEPSLGIRGDYSDRDSSKNPGCNYSDRESNRSPGTRSNYSDRDSNRSPVARSSYSDRDSSRSPVARSSYSDRDSNRSPVARSSYSDRDSNRSPVARSNYSDRDSNRSPVARRNYSDRDSNRSPVARSNYSDRDSSRSPVARSSDRDSNRSSESNYSDRDSNRSPVARSSDRDSNRSLGTRSNYSDKDSWRNQASRSDYDKREAQDRNDFIQRETPDKYNNTDGRSNAGDREKCNILKNSDCNSGRKTLTEIQTMQHTEGEPLFRPGTSGENNNREAQRERGVKRKNSGSEAGIDWAAKRKNVDAEAFTERHGSPASIDRETRTEGARGETDDRDSSEPTASGRGQTRDRRESSNTPRDRDAVETIRENNRNNSGSERKDYDPPALETLFKKTTTALPNIYWLPLTEDQIEEKKNAHRNSMAAGPEEGQQSEEEDQHDEGEEGGQQIEEEDQHEQTEGQQSIEEGRQNMEEGQHGLADEVQQNQDDSQLNVHEGQQNLDECQQNSDDGEDQQNVDDDHQNVDEFESQNVVDSFCLV